MATAAGASTPCSRLKLTKSQLTRWGPAILVVGIVRVFPDIDHERGFCDEVSGVSALEVVVTRSRSPSSTSHARPLAKCSVADLIISWQKA